MKELEASYLAADDPIRGSGFGGGAARWEVERGVILEALDTDGSILDVGCANGHLLVCLVTWANERGLVLRPHGLELSAPLAALAGRRIEALGGCVHQGDAWTWEAPRRYDYVYVVHDVVPAPLCVPLLQRMHARLLAPGGRLIVGAYGSRSERRAPTNVGALLDEAGLAVMGEARAGRPITTHIAWARAA